MVAKQYFGEALVVFRTGSGDLRALDAHCLHIGAHLGLGGTVRGDRIICPFHGWEWNAEGENVCIPYEDRPNKGIRMRTWTVAERNETVYLWHDATGSAPTWDVPDAFEVVGGDIAERTFHPAHPDGEVRFGPKAREWNDRALLQGWRERWGDHVNERLLELGIVPEGDSPASFAAYVKADIAKWKRVIEQANVPKI